MINTKRPLSGPTMTIASINIEGISQEKEILLAQLCKDVQCDVLCVQETHRDQNMNTPKIDGIKLVNIIHHKKHGSAMFVKNTIAINSMQIHGAVDMEVLTIDLGTILISSIYKPPNTNFNPITISNQDVQQKIRVVIGDFNSHSQAGVTEI